MLAKQTHLTLTHLKSRKNEGRQVISFIKVEITSFIKAGRESAKINYFFAQVEINRFSSFQYCDTQQTAEVRPLSPTSAQMQGIFAEAERQLPFCRGQVFSGMLSFSDNREEPIHRWYSYKEAYSHRLVAKVLERYPMPSGYPAVLDPFCGSGTTLLVAQSHKLPAIGVELNPFAAFVSLVKTSWHRTDPEYLDRALEIVLDDTSPAPSSLPELTTFHKKLYFPNGHAYELFRLKNAICSLRATEEVKNALKLSLAATIEDVSCLHKDGRMLRYIARNPISPREALYRRTKNIIEELQSIAYRPNHDITVLQGDARSLDSLIAANTLTDRFGLILYSPPYLNSFDYSEVYKCELWLLGLIKSYEQWRQLRRSTFRSHPSCKFPVTHHLRDNPALREVWILVEQAARCSDIGGSAQKQTPQIIRGYFDDVFKMLQGQFARLAPGGHIVCVVGNSKHGQLHIPTDTLIAKIGQALGLELVEIYVAKYRQDRKQKKNKLRESLVVFRNPERP